MYYFLSYRASALGRAIESWRTFFDIRGRENSYSCPIASQSVPFPCWIPDQGNLAGRPWDEKSHIPVPKCPISLLAWPFRTKQPREVDSRGLGTSHPLATSNSNCMVRIDYKVKQAASVTGQGNRVLTACADSQSHSRYLGNLVALILGSSRRYMTPILL